MHSAMGRFGDELDQLAIRLQARNVEIYGTYDRAAAEADLRVNVGFSASVLIGAIAARGNFDLFLLIPCAWFLVARGRQKAREANDILIQAVVSGELESGILSSALPQLATASSSSMGRDNEAATGGDLDPPTGGDPDPA
ncbi:hypothetical protein [Streptomyces sp. 8L]|uniref:hypothetical protein n=1 Tax=Streptomyces sp. 8L TaxID=2877242 RepID=UPI001CD6F5D1|nr:hypothetical protein [Streptomyces sp. 8L]MCA1223296.1 hypothetical protein [Streptomyces sp. 8L]